ncbi:MAG: periplasmic heavy metal sensor [Acidobacteriota bacterium]
MNVRMSRVLVLLAITVCALAATWTLAQLPARNSAAATGVAGAPGRPGPDRWGVDRLEAVRIIARYLDLSDEQADQVRQILQTTRAEVEPLRQEIRTVAPSLRDELESGNPAPQTVGRLVIQVHTLRDQIRGERQAAVESIRGLLTEEQNQKAGAILRAARLEPVIRAFGVLGLLPPPEVPRGGAGEPAE